MLTANYAIFPLSTQYNKLTNLVFQFTGKIVYSQFQLKIVIIASAVYIIICLTFPGSMKTCKFFSKS